MMKNCQLSKTRFDVWWDQTYSTFTDPPNVHIFFCIMGCNLFYELMCSFLFKGNKMSHKNEIKWKIFLELHQQEPKAEVGLSL